ncbi:MAG: universal stress protein [Bacteroidales bacterium]
MWNYPPQRILVAVDFGDASKRALAVAGVLAHRFGAALEVLHSEAFEAPAYFTHDQVRTIEREMKTARTLADRHVSAFAAPLIDGPFSVRVVEGPAAVSILEAGRASDLIVMGTHGRRGPTRWWLGSVAERVVSETTVPTLVVRAGDVSDARAVFRRPLMVAGAEPFDGEAMRLANGLAEAFGGEAAPAAATCEADIAREREATLMVVARHSGGGPFGASQERLLRLCTLSMLFVPSHR